MKILFVTHHTKFRASLRIISLAQRIATRGHEVTVMCIRGHGRLGIRSYDEAGMHYVEMPDLLRGSLRTGWDPWDAVNRWHYLNRQFDFDLIHAFETRPVTIHPLQFALSRKTVPLVIDWIDWWGSGGLITTNRPSWYPSLFARIETFYEEHFRSMADATTVISAGLGKRAEGLGIRTGSIFKVLLGANTEKIPFVPPSTHRDEFGFEVTDQIAFFSALFGMMDIDLVFDAALNVLKTHPQFKLVMTGKGGDQLVLRAKECGLGDRFVHLGFLPDEFFVNALTCADLFLLPFADKPYNHGRWPCKIGDYLAAGRPIVSNPVGEVKTIMEKFPVGVMTPFDSVEFAAGIRQLLDDPEKMKVMRWTARYVAETELKWDRIIDGLEKAYLYAINRKTLNSVKASVPVKKPLPLSPLQAAAMLLNR